MSDTVRILVPKTALVLSPSIHPALLAALVPVATAIAAASERTKALVQVCLTPGDLELTTANTERVVLAFVGPQRTLSRQEGEDETIWWFRAHLPLLAGSRHFVVPSTTQVETASQKGPAALQALASACADSMRAWAKRELLSGPSKAVRTEFIRPLSPEEVNYLAVSRQFTLVPPSDHVFVAILGDEAADQLLEKLLTQGVGSLIAGKFGLLRRFASVQACLEAGVPAPRMIVLYDGSRTPNSTAEEQAAQLRLDLRRHEIHDLPTKLLFHAMKMVLR